MAVLVDVGSLWHCGRVFQSLGYRGGLWRQRHRSPCRGRVAKRGGQPHADALRGEQPWGSGVLASRISLCCPGGVQGQAAPEGSCGSC